MMTYAYRCIFGSLYFSPKIYDHVLELDFWFWLSLFESGDSKLAWAKVYIRSLNQKRPQIIIRSGSKCMEMHILSRDALSNTLLNQKVYPPFDM